MFSKKMIALTASLFSLNTFAAETNFWSVDLDGIIVKNNGEVGVSVIMDSPANPGSSNSTWDNDCRFLYFHRNSNGEPTSDLVRAEMVRAGNTAALTGKSVRVGVFRLEGDSRCFTTQLWVN